MNIKAEIHRAGKMVFVTLLLVCILPLSCLDKIDIEIPQAVKEGLVIEGQLTQGNPSHIRVSLTRIFDFTANSRKPVNVRDVFLIDDIGNRVEIPEKSPGVYETTLPPDLIPVEVGNAYGINIFTQDGRELLSTLDPLLAVPEPTKITLEPVEVEVSNAIGEPSVEDFFRFILHTSANSSEPGRKARLQWQIERTYKLTDSPMPPPAVDPKTCFITEAADVFSISILDANTLIDVSEVIVPVYETPINSQFAEGYYLTVYQQSLSEGAYQYWDQVSQVVERTGNMFEAPAGKIQSNISNIEENSSDEIFGYFYATQRDTIRLFVSPETANNPETFCPGPPSLPPPGGGCPRVPCCDCLVAEQSTTVRPNFWVE
ncbi:MAG: DUF4249 domain-containing protein [Saprospiraceae bacterium]|nr:DUF4249 domain-containing protein [Saprospiraceae bacterium]